MFETNKRYSFSVYGNSTLGSNFVGVKLTNILDYKMASKMEVIDNKAVQIYPYLPEGTPRNHKTYTYYMFEDKNGNSVIIANWWIIPNSVKEIQGLDYTITLINSSPEQAMMVRDQLRQLGIDFKIE